MNRVLHMHSEAVCASSGGDACGTPQHATASRLAGTVAGVSACCYVPVCVASVRTKVPW